MLMTPCLLKTASGVRFKCREAEGMELLAIARAASREWTEEFARWVSCWNCETPLFSSLGLRRFAARLGNMVGPSLLSDLLFGSLAIRFLDADLSGSTTWT